MRMALLSAAILPSATSSLALWSFCQTPPSIVLPHSPIQHRLHSSKALSHILCKPRASLSGSDPQPSDSEDPFQKSEEFPEEDESANSPTEPTIDKDPSLNSSAFSSGPSSLTSGALDSSSSSSASPPVNNVAASQFEKDHQQEELRATLDTLSRSLELLSSTLSEISSAVRVLSSALGNSQLQVASPGAGYRSPTELRDAREAKARQGMSDPPEPWDNAAAAMEVGGSEGIVDEDNSRSEEDTIPSYLVEQNERAHKLAYRLQQAFIQARIEGLGKPFQVAAEDFVQACMEAHGLGIGLKELQLQLVLQDGSLTGAFAIRNQRWSHDPILNEESRIRSLWVRLVYSTLAQLGPTYTEEGEVDPIDAFVKQVLQMSFEQGYDLARLKLEQAFAGPDQASGAVKTLRENQYLILLTLDKAKSQNI